MINMTNPEYQGFWIRFAALFLDALILGIPISLLQLGAILVKMNSLMYIIQIAYVLLLIYMEGVKGGTPGKLIIGMKVVDEKGEFIGFGGAFLRYIGKLLSGLILCIGYLMIAWDPKKQGLHDKIAKTYVVKG